MNEGSMKPPLVILTGPTAVGKTSLSIRLAKAIGGEIISADSMQIYKKMKIGTARVSHEEMEGIPHYLVGELDPSQEFNVVEFKRRAKKAMTLIRQHGHIPVIVGGTGFYIQALLYDIDFSKHDDKKVYRQELQQILGEKGKEYLHTMLKEVDPEYAAEVHYNNAKRVIRALEYFHETGEKLSLHNKQQRGRISPYRFACFVLDMDRDSLYRRIDQRVDMMMQAGLKEEAENLKKEGYTRELVSMQGIGYKEFFDYFDGLISIEDTIENIKKDTRHFAKRQLTWFRREKDVIWIRKEDYQDEGTMLNEMLQILAEKEIVL